MLKLQVNKDKIFEYKQEKKNHYLDNHFINADILKTAENRFHILYNNKSYNTEVVKVDRENKTVFLKINGKECEVKVSDLNDQLLARLGINIVSSGKLNELKAPMPGLILEILVSDGQQVTKGTPLIILEAMKMENIIKATGDGEVKSVLVNKGQAVEKNQPLIKF